jgi:hypothetical protein
MSGPPQQGGGGGRRRLSVPQICLVIVVLGIIMSSFRVNGVPLSDYIHLNLWQNPNTVQSVGAP